MAKTTEQAQHWDPQANPFHPAHRLGVAGEKPVSRMSRGLDFLDISLFFFFLSYHHYHFFFIFKQLSFLYNYNTKDIY